MEYSRRQSMPQNEGHSSASEQIAIASAHEGKKCLKSFFTRRSKANPSTKALPWEPKDIPRLASERANLEESDRNTFLYLAYGSNLAAETFQGRRGIKPLAQMNVVVPALRLTFDLPGIPYSEPCFANSGRRDPEHHRLPFNASSKEMPSHPLSNSATKPEYNKDSWKKGLVGVVYEVTPTDYAHIIATEGGGAAYTDILVPCYPLSPDADTVPANPETKPFLAHTLFCPAVPASKAPRGGRLQRPDTSYAQPSARYLGLITRGAEECQLPLEYRDYLNSIHSYTITTRRQRIGQAAFTTLWGPILAFLFIVLFPRFSDEDGRAPEWIVKLAGVIFSAVWASYDNGFKVLFGDGERTEKTSGTVSKDADDFAGKLEAGLDA
ncbi:MAG: hypothetical protein M1820_000403 [Bogoriella megaspora]|nr:MAG: hypothetical protein M1820_000403 [Bogoriella megaspora]